jgi:tetrapyrrole methylase family protein/MazG family protein
VILRTRVHPGLDDFVADPRVADCDDLYRTLPTFDAVYEAIATRVCAAATNADVVYAVPGHPRFGEQSVALLLDRAATEGIPVAVLDAISALDVAATAVGIDPIAAEVQIVDAARLAGSLESDPFAGGQVALDPRHPCLVTQVYGAHVASGLKLALGRLFPDDHPIAVIRAAGVPGQERITHCALFELDRQPVDHLTSVWVRQLPPLAADRSFPTLQRIIAQLRAPGGCPWDREQTHASLRDALIEEAHEAADAIDAEDTDNLAEELGDLLLQVVLHAQIGEENGDFVLEDVVQHVARKLVRRHPHVFGEATATTPSDVMQTWAEIKAAERRSANNGVDVPVRPVDRLPRSMPALARAAHLLDAGSDGRQTVSSPSDEAAIGDRLLATVHDALARGVDAERALDKALRRRFEDQRSTVVGAPAARRDKGAG